ncbi:MAG: SDR family NAD(P)-dependent oxidoreductase [Pseudomonadota bacterium]
MLDPNGRVIMVSGANRGIGLAIAKALAQRGYSLSLGARDQEALAAATADVPGERVERCFYEATAPESAEAWVADTIARFGRLDGLVNTAGILRRTALETPSEEILNELWQVNVLGPFTLTRVALPHLKAGGQGRVVNLASLSGKRVASGNGPGYPMTKFAVVALTHATRQLLWDDGVRVTAVCPGYVSTDMVADVTSHAQEAMTQPEDLAELVATVIALPNSASVPELLVNCRLEDTV